MKAKPSILGIFDSGVGGFSVFREVRKNTDADIIYFGDCARAPYGNKKEEEIVSYIKEILLFLKEKGCTHFVSACNSMSVLTTEKLLEEVVIEKEKYLDMVSAVKMIPFSSSDTVLVIGTQATIRSGVYQHILEEKNILHNVFSPISLAGAIEQDTIDTIVNEIGDVLLCAKNNNATHILYGCTHYPLVDKIFQEQAQACGWHGIFIDPAEYVAKQVESFHLKGNSSSYFETSLETKVFSDYVKKYRK